MAGPVQTILQKLSGEYSAKVQEARNLEAKKKKPFVTDADVKKINEQIKIVKRDYEKLNAKYNELAKLEKTANEYLDLNKQLKEIEASIIKADSRGESTTLFKQKRTGAVARLKTISPDVERSFPSLKVAIPVVTTPAPATPTGTPVKIPSTPVKVGVTGTPTVTPTVTPIVTPVKIGGTGATGATGPTGAPIDREAEALNVAAGTDFTLPETLFKNIPSLTALLNKYVSTPGMQPDAFRKALRDDVWYKQNSAEIKARYVQYYNYRDLQASGRAQGTTDYEMQIDKIVASLTKRAAVIGSAAASDPAALRKAAENLYITNRSEDQSFVDDFLAASIKSVGGMIGGKPTQGYSGQALANYQELLKTARSNGFQISDIIPGGANEQQVLQNIASGKLDINRVIQDTRKLAAQGQPQYVRDLLSQGYNLDQVYAPYRQTMATVLEIDDPNSIDLNDSLLRSAITDKGDMNIYDFKKKLRQDNRWQYTGQAKQEVSDVALRVLQDFGFQG
jgi:hypothetical protein